MSIPSGVFPLGAYVEYPSQQPSGPRPIYADMIDPLTGDISDWLGTRTPVDGAIIEGLRVERNSGPAVEFVGTTLREIRHTDPTSLGEATTRTRDGLLELERAHLAKLKSATVELSERGDGIKLSAQILDFTVPNGKPEARSYSVVRGAV